MKLFVNHLIWDWWRREFAYQSRQSYANHFSFWPMLSCLMVSLRPPLTGAQCCFGATADIGKTSRERCGFPIRSCHIKIFEPYWNYMNEYVYLISCMNILDIDTSARTCIAEYKKRGRVSAAYRLYSSVQMMDEHGWTIRIHCTSMRISFRSLFFLHSSTSTVDGEAAISIDQLSISTAEIQGLVISSRCSTQSAAAHWKYQPMCSLDPDALSRLDILFENHWHLWSCKAQFAEPTFVW